MLVFTKKAIYLTDEDFFSTRILQKPTLNLSLVFKILGKFFSRKIQNFNYNFSNN
jgi:hypothetical protein